MSPFSSLPVARPWQRSASEGGDGFAAKLSAPACASTSFRCIAAGDHRRDGDPQVDLVQREEAERKEELRAQR
eukprot:5779466-Pyramimonas_sp.AAC.1